MGFVWCFVVAGANVVCCVVVVVEACEVFD